jgi:hypothetical protein
MARSLARDAEDFARLMLQTIEQLSREGGWIRGTDAFDQALNDHPDHAYVAQLRAKPTRRIGLSAVIERLRLAAFPHIERRKAGNRRNAPVFYRIARAGPGLDLQLPYEVAASHPLVVQRRTEAAPRERGSARRAALTEAPPKSPWRRRVLLLRPAAAAAAIEPWPPLLRLWWARLLGVLATMTAGITGR